jgi:hypothetical protein
MRFLRSPKLGRFLTARRLPVHVAAIAVVLLLPSLWSGWYLDDWLQQAELLGVSGLEGSGRLLARLDATRAPGLNAAMMDRGMASWWMKPEATIDFFRPLSALALVLDSVLAPGKAWVAHLHSLAWLALLVFVAALAYRRFLGVSSVAGLAALLYAVDEARGSTATWIANRDGLISGLFGLLALLAHDRWRKEGSVVMALLGPVLLAAALLSAEGAIVTTAYLFAYALFLDGGSKGRRFVSLLPYVAMAIAWKLIHHGLGNGISDTHVYVDPVADPRSFLQALLARWPLFVADQFFSMPIHVWMVLSFPLNLIYSGLALGLAALLAAAVLPLLRRSALARFWAAGSLLAMVPLCGGLTLDRGLTLAAFGGAALVAMALQSWGFLPAGRGSEPQVSPGWRRRLGSYWVLVHLIVAPLLMLSVPFRQILVSRAFVDPFEEAVPKEPSVTEQTVVFVNGIESSIWYIPLMRALRGEPEPRAVRLLVPSVYQVEVERTDADSLLLRVPQGYHSVAADQGFRRPADTLPVGCEVRIQGMTAEIREHNDEGLASVVAFHFDVPLDDPSLVWRYSDAGGIRPFVLPPMGESVTLASPFKRR